MDRSGKFDRSIGYKGIFRSCIGYFMIKSLEVVFSSILSVITERVSGGRKSGSIRMG